MVNWTTSGQLGVGCAIIRREQERLGIEQTEQCKSVLRIIAGMVQYTKGEPLGDNFSDEGLTTSAADYNLNNVVEL